MLPASLYEPLYHHAMLLVVIGCALLYWARQRKVRSLAQFNQVAMVVIGVVVLLFMGFRPRSLVFIDMSGYVTVYEHAQQGSSEGGFNDWLYNVLMWLCAPVLSSTGFIFVCALIYIAPLAIAAWRTHGAWAFPVFLASLTALSFWAYGVNGIRNGMATSVLILAFAFHDRPFVMLPLMAAATGFHGSVLLPAGAFLIVRYVKRTEIWLAFWVLCVAASLVAGNVGEMLLSHYNPFTWDNRVEGYILSSQGGDFRADFLAYSIFPVLVTLLLAAPARARSRRSHARVRSGPALNWIRKRSAMSVKGMGRGRLAGLHGASPMGSLALAGFGPISHDPRSALGATLSALPSSVALAKEDLSSIALAKEDQLPVLRSFSKGGSTRDRSSALGGQAVSARHEKTTPSAWNRLPWVRLLRLDPFYARLVNTYLLANAIWVLVIHAEFSNRFAYLSWFVLPWVLLYPFVPGKAIHRPRAEFIAAILFVHYMFTYFMVVVVYPLRGIGM